MGLEKISIEDWIFEYVDQFRDMLSLEVWSNVLMSCTKNELFVLFYLYRKGESNMSQIATYLKVPLNTATGIIGRMERRLLVQRQRSADDKRVVTTVLTATGRSQIDVILSNVVHYGQRIFDVLSKEDCLVLKGAFEKIVATLKEVEPPKPDHEKSIRKIVIE